VILYKNIFIFLFFFISVIISPANAYIDPGTGSFILQAIIAVGASIIVFLKNPITMIKLFFKSKKKKKNNKKIDVS
jgi:amino acid transporter